MSVHLTYFDALRVVFLTYVHLSLFIALSLSMYCCDDVSTAEHDRASSVAGG